MKFAILRVLPLLCLLTLAASAQTPTPKSDPIPQSTIDLTVGKPIASLSSSSLFNAPRCSEDGTTFYDVFADLNIKPVRLFPDLYSIDSDGNAKHLQRKLPSEYSHFNFLDSFAGQKGFVSLILATEKKNPTDPDAKKARAYYVVTSSEDGTSSTPLQLDVEFTPIKIAVLSSGRYITLGFDPINFIPVLATLNEDGTLHRILDFDHREINKDTALAGTNNISNPNDSSSQRSLDLASISGSMFIPLGKNVLLVQSRSSLPMREVTDGGEVRSLKLQLPLGYLLQELLVSDINGPIVARLESAADLQAIAKKSFVQNPDQIIATFSRDSGKPLKLMKVKGPHAGEVTCATQGKLTAIYSPDAKADQPDEQIFASTPF